MWPAPRAPLPPCRAECQLRSAPSAQQLREPVAGPDAPSEPCSFGTFIMNLDKKMRLLNLWVIQSREGEQINWLTNPASKITFVDQVQQDAIEVGEASLVGCMQIQD